MLNDNDILLSLITFNHVCKLTVTYDGFTEPKRVWKGKLNKQK